MLFPAGLSDLFLEMLVVSKAGLVFIDDLQEVVGMPYGQVRCTSSRVRGRRMTVDAVRSSGPGHPGGHQPRGGAHHPARGRPGDRGGGQSVRAGRSHRRPPDPGGARHGNKEDVCGNLGGRRLDYFYGLELLPSSPGPGEPWRDPPVPPPALLSAHLGGRPAHPPTPPAPAHPQKTPAPLQHACAY
eukprot:4886396-Pyramimonas_sp.AAC.1